MSASDAELVESDPVASLRAPLRTAWWDGRTLTLQLPASTSPVVLALDVDGAFFDEAVAGGDGAVRFAFPFAPAAHDSLVLLPRLGRDGEALAAAPLTVRFGIPGIAAPHESGPVTAAPPGTAMLAPATCDLAAVATTVVVPVFNAPELVRRCIESVLAHSTGRTRLVVIDDASTDAGIAPLLERYAGRPGIEVLRNPANRGFTATANRGIDAAGDDDVVLLNADTEVGPHWLVGLRRAAYAAHDIATATAVSDNAGAFSVPELEVANRWPDGWSFDDAARALWQDAGHAYPELPTGNGFCMYVRRVALDRVGRLDEAAFAQGYGEENDFCQRAAQAGFRHVVAGNVYVRHARSSSFGDARRAALGEQGMAVLRERYPDYERDVGRALRSYVRRVLDWRIRRLFVAAGSVPATRVLWLGTPPAGAAPRVWSVVDRDGGMVLVDDAGCVRERGGSARSLALHDWLQRYGFDGAVIGDDTPVPDAAEIAARLLLPSTAGSGVDPLGELAVEGRALASFPERVV